MSVQFSIITSNVFVFSWKLFQHSIKFSVPNNQITTWSTWNNHIIVVQQPIVRRFLVYSHFGFLLTSIITFQLLASVNNTLYFAALARTLELSFLNLLSYVYWGWLLLQHYILFFHFHAAQLKLTFLWKNFNTIAYLDILAQIIKCE